MFVPGEPEIGANFATSVHSSVGNTSSGGPSAGANVHVIHPVQFGSGAPQRQQQPEGSGRYRALAQMAKGGHSGEDQLHHARDLAQSGHAVQQYQPRGLTNTAIRTA